MSQTFQKTKPSFLKAGLPCALLSAECQGDNNARQRPPQNRLHSQFVTRLASPPPLPVPVISHSSPVTQQQLAAWCLVHPAPGMRITVVPEPGTTTVSQDGTRGCLAITWAYVPGHLGIDSTEEIQATFNGELADRHPPTGPASEDGSGKPEGREGVRLLTWGDPYLMAWLEALRGEALSDDDYRTAGLQRDTNPFESA